MGPVGPPEMPSGRIVVEPPPALDEPEGTGTVLTSTVPMVGSLGSLAVVATMSSQSGGGHRSMLAAAVFLVGTLAFVVVQVDRQRTRRVHHLTRSRRGYLRHLAEVRARVRQASAEQELALLWHHPSPEVLPAVVTEGSRVWERTGAHPWAGRLRYAVGDLPPAVELVGPGPGSGDDPDPFAVDALRRLLAAHGRTHGVPLTLELATTRAVQVSGTPETARSLVRAVLCQAAAFHPPDDLVVAVLAADDALRHWEWVKWLPHAHSRTCRDAVGARRLVADSVERLAELVSDRSGRLLLVVDGIRLPSDHPWSRSEEGVTRLEVGEGDAPDPPDRDVLRLRVVPGSPHPSLAVVDRSGEPTATGTADQCGVATAEALARRLLPLRPLRTGRSSGQGPLAALVAGSLASDVPWPSRPGREQLRVPIGTEDDGSTVHLDLKEAARQGAGPHGLVVGATGSGKSELLRTLVLGLAATHSPEDLNLVLVDFKGGATFAGLAPLPHVSGLVTNLADDLALVDRVQDALMGEVVRRQELLHATGPFASAHDHRRAREAGADLAPLPSLLVVVDEFSELLAARPEFLDVFTSIGRLGRSLGIHLVLASQRLEEGRLRGLESHLSYRVALRTFTTSESRAVLGVPDAAELPPAPGVGYLRTGPSRPVRFRATYVSGPAAAPVRRRRRPVAGPFTAAEVPDKEAAPADSADTPAALLDAVVARLADRGPRARRIWHPPLGRADPLGELVGRLDRHPDLGLVASGRRGRPLRIPIGIVDRPLHRR
ncbi:MAG TPA: type VII secretion protein EccCa, partial [Nocardioides sp.]|nr:type VII secretion protein EccCa [Nocardioides sp.]